VWQAAPGTPEDGLLGPVPGARESRDAEIRTLLEAALEKLKENP
jgi:hypothetical protein